MTPDAAKKNILLETDIMQALHGLRAGLPQDVDLTSGDISRFDAMASVKPSYRQAAVLIPIVQRTQPTLLLTQRASHLSRHAGQIAFPGGRVEPEDQDRRHTALRETEEEVGIRAADIDVLAELPDYHTGTGYCVRPIIGLLPPNIRPVPDASEVAAVFEVPLAHVLKPENHLRHSREWQGKPREYWAIPYQQHYIWGATAGMLVNLSRLVTAVANSQA